MLYLFMLSLMLFGCANNNQDASAGSGKNSPIGVREANTNLPAMEGALTLILSTEAAAKGETVCVKVSVNDFEDIISMQYTLAWDPAIIRFNRIQSFGLPMFGQDNFGTHLTQTGLLTSVWIDMSLKGVDLTEGSSIYEVCFDLIGEPGTGTSIEFKQNPTPFEVVNAQEKLLELNGVPGAVNIQL